MRRATWAAALVAASIAGPLQAQVPGQKSVDGIVVRIGIVDAKQVAKHATGHAETGMHGAKKGSGGDHVVVSLADERSGQFIREAEVWLAVDRSGVGHVRQKLEPMAMPDAPSFGGWLDLRQPGPYRITVEVSRPGVPRRILARFDMKNR